MGFFTYFSYASKTVIVTEKQDERVVQGVAGVSSDAEHSSASDSEDSASPSASPIASEPLHLAPEEVPLPQSPVASAEPSNVASTSSLTAPTTTKPPPIRRFSFRPFSLTQPKDEHKHLVSAAKEHEKKANAAAAFSKRLARPLTSNSKKRARESALVVRSLIVGPSMAASPKLTSAIAKPQLSKIKTQLMQPKSANKLIAQLRALPIADADEHGEPRHSTGPIHAVCLEHTEAEEQEIHFARLNRDRQEDEFVTQATFDWPSISAAPLETLSEMFNDMHIVNLVKAPDLGLGQPGDGEGILAGAVPTAETVIKGIEQITPQLLALGFATGRAMVPDHKGVYPPTDRMSVLTYWWGLEIALPPPSLDYLSNAHSVSNAIMNFLSALSLVNTGVREILPFVRYISQFIDFEFNAIKAQNKGDGVVCAATWIMPAALVPRPWDFLPDPAKEIKINPPSQPIQKPLPDTPTADVPMMPFPVHQFNAVVPNVTITSATPSPESVGVAVVIPDTPPTPTPVTVAA